MAGRPAGRGLQRGGNHDAVSCGSSRSTAAKSPFRFVEVLQELDQRLAAMPAELATAVARQPELKETLARVNKPRSR